MGCDTIGRIKGFMKHDDLLNYIKEKWDPNHAKRIRNGILFPASYILCMKENFDSYFIITAVSISMKIYITIHR